MLSVICMTLFVISIRSVFGAENILLNLKEQVTLQSSTIILKDIADLRGPNSEILDQLAQTTLGAAPHLGLVSTLSRYQILSLIQKAYSPTPEIIFSGAEVVQIRLQGRLVKSEEISRIIKAYITRNTSWEESEIEILSMDHPQVIELPPGEAHLQISSSLPVTGRGKIILPMETVQGDQILQRFWVTTNIRINVGILTAAKSIRRGKVLDREDVVMSSAILGDLHATYLGNSDELLGKISERNFSPGDPLTREGFSDPLLIKRGDVVQLKLERNGLVIAAQGRAEQDGRLGQTIKVRNLEFSTLLNAQVTGRAEVKVQ